MDPTRRRHWSCEANEGKDALLDLVLTSKEELVGNVKVGGSLGCNGYEVVKLRILREGSKANSRMGHSDVL